MLMSLLVKSLVTGFLVDGQKRHIGQREPFATAPARERSLQRPCSGHKVWELRDESEWGQGLGITR